MALRVGEDVRWLGRTYVLRGLDPMGVAGRKAELEHMLGAYNRRLVRSAANVGALFSTTVRLSPPREDEAAPGRSQSPRGGEQRHAGGCVDAGDPDEAPGRECDDGRRGERHGGGGDDPGCGMPENGHLAADIGGGAASGDPSMGYTAASSASTTCGSKCVPEHARSSATASACESAGR